MPDVFETGRSFVKGADEGAIKKQEEAVEVASQWAQEKIENFLLELGNDSSNTKLLKISYIISRRTSVDVFEAEKSDLGPFIGKIIGKLVDGQVKEGLISLAEGAIDKLLGSSSGAAKTDKVYEVAFDELGGLNRLDAFFFCYKFAAVGLNDFSKAVIGTCIVRSAAYMVDDNAYRVVLTSCATLRDEERSEINKHLIDVAARQRNTKDEDGEPITIEAGVLEERAKLAQVIGNGVAHSTEFEARKLAKQLHGAVASAQSEARALLAATPAVPTTSTQPAITAVAQ